jgi:hypothetical protein
VLIDPDHMAAWCKRQGIRLDNEGRAAYGALLGASGGDKAKLDAAPLRRSQSAAAATEFSMMLMSRDLARHIDPSLWFTDAGLTPDPWQQAAIRSSSKRQLWNVHRQGGKSVTAGLKALKKSQDAGSLTLLISPSERQSSELLRKVAELHAKIEGLPEPIAVAAHKLEWQHGGRVVSLPASGTTIRGYSKVDLLILDEASRIPSELIGAVRPMLAISAGELVCLSTPNGRQGFFYESWENGGPLWERTMITADQCARIDPAFLQEERETLGEMVFRQEYFCAFVACDEAAFPTSIIDAAFSMELRPLCC